MHKTILRNGSGFGSGLGSKTQQIAATNPLRLGGHYVEKSLKMRLTNA